MTTPTQGSQIASPHVASTYISNQIMPNQSTNQPQTPQNGGDSHPPAVLSSVISSRRGNSNDVKNKIPDSRVDSIDSALLAALRDPRERLGLLKLEQCLVDFCTKQPQDAFIDVGGPYNSIVISPSLGALTSPQQMHAQKSQTTFQRCILHRLADRFAITRESNMDGSIRLWKNEDSKSPSRLLLDVSEEEYNLSARLEQVSLTNNISSNQPSNNKKKNKMKIMKRNNSNPINIQSRTSAKNKKKTLSDKEKAYAEARARIFQQEQQESKQQDTNDERTSSLPTPSSAIQNSISNASMYVVTPPGDSITQSSPQEENASLSSLHTESSNNKPSKATFRDRRQEENDPDFQRGGSMMVPQAYDCNDPYYGYNNGIAQLQQMQSLGVGTGSSYPVPTQTSHAAYAQYLNQGQPISYPATKTTTTTATIARNHNTVEGFANLHSFDDFPSLR